MTIIANVKVRDGIVLATDSMSQIISSNESGDIGIIKAYSNARKLFRIRKLPVGVMVCGLGSIGVRSIESLVLEFSRDKRKYGKPPWTVETICRELYGYIKSIYDKTFKDVPNEQKRKHLRLGFYMSGYSPRKYLAHTWEFELPDSDDIQEVRAEAKFGASWRGVPFPFGRLYNGYDPRIIKALKDAGVEEKILKEVFAPERWRTPTNYDGMPVQDAINFAVHILETTIGVATFELGPAPTCGGPLQVAVILPDREWKWVCQPELIMQ